MSTSVPRFRVGILGILTIVSYGSWFYGFGVLLDDMATDFGSGVGILTIGYTIAQVLTGVFGMFIGRMVDRRGARHPFALGAVIGPNLMLASTFVGSPLLFAVLFGLGGGAIGASSFYHLTQTVVARLAKGAEARAIAQLTIWGALSSPILIPLTELARSTMGWRNTVRVGALVVGLVLVVCAVVIDRGGETRSELPSESSRLALRTAWSNPQVRRFAWSSLCGSFGTSIVMVLQIPAMVAGGLERSTAASMAGARGFAQLLGRLPLGRLLMAYSSRHVLIGAKLLVAIGAVLLSLSGNLTIALLFVVIAGIGIGATSPLDGIYAREVLPAADLGTLMGSMHFAGGLASGLGPLFGALIIDLTGRTWTGLAVAAVVIVLGTLVLVEPRGVKTAAVG